MRIRATVAAILVGMAALWPRSVNASVVTVANEASGWVLRVDGQVFFVRGVAYTPDRVGEDPNNATLHDWSVGDINGNGLVDTVYDSFLDLNHNNIQDAAEPAIGDWSLLSEMGANTIRVYHHPSDDPSVQAGYGSATTRVEYNHAPNKAIYRDLFVNHGIRFMMGDFLGAYTIGSGGATSTDYTDATQRARMLASVQQMVKDFKDEPGLLMYVLGNENNLAITQTNAGSQPVAYATLVEQAASLIKSLDPNHPVMVCLGDQAIASFVSTLQANAPSIDIIGGNVYRYPAFATFFSDVKGAWDKPVMFTEYGDLQSQFIFGDLDESRQATVHAAAVADIEANAAGGSGQNNSIGGVAFEWLDSWWQNGSPSTHDIINNYPTTVDNEWHGIAAQGNGAVSPFLRQLRQVYFQYQAHWLPAAHHIAAGGGAAIFNNVGQVTTIRFPSGTFPSGADIQMTPMFSFPPADSASLLMTGTGTGFDLSAGGLQPLHPVTIYFPFGHNNAGYVLARYDTAHGSWVPLNTRRDTPGFLVADTSHFTLFQVMLAEKSPSVDNVIAFPNPARPALGNTGITFTQLPPGTHLRLFTAAGELVRELSADAAGVASWDLHNRDGREAASGVYFAFLDGNGSQRTIKVAVQR